VNYVNNLLKINKDIEYIIMVDHADR
jgi:hypothetical protein